MTENASMLGPADPESLEADKEETSLYDALENSLDISRDVGLTERPALEETESEGKLEERDGTQDGQNEEPEDQPEAEQTVSPPAAEASSSSSSSGWAAGAPCRAVWSEDGWLYSAKILSLDGERCRVVFDDYGNEEEVDVSELKSPEDDLQTPQNSQEWKPGSHCRATYSADGLTYPAVVLWVKGQRCRVRFNSYNNEEEQDVSGLLSPNELHGNGKAATARTRTEIQDRGSNRKSGVTSSGSDVRVRREENQRERGRERRSTWRDDPLNFSAKEKPVHQNSDEKKEVEKPTSFFPPFPPPQLSSTDHVPFIPPPPPPLWKTEEKESDSTSATATMLMLWYTCGYHTGSYMAQQEFKSKH